MAWYNSGEWIGLRADKFPDLMHEALYTINELQAICGGAETEWQYRPDGLTKTYPAADDFRGIGVGPLATRFCRGAHGTADNRVWWLFENFKLAQWAVSKFIYGVQLAARAGTTKWATSAGDRTELVLGWPVANWKQRITLSGATGGTFAVNFGGTGFHSSQVSFAINHDDDGDAVAAALNDAWPALSDPFSVSGSAGGPWEVDFLAFAIHYGDVAAPAGAIPTVQTAVIDMTVASDDLTPGEAEVAVEPIGTSSLLDTGSYGDTWCAFSVGLRDIAPWDQLRELLDKLKFPVFYPTYIEPGGQGDDILVTYRRGTGVYGWDDAWAHLLAGDADAPLGGHGEALYGALQSILSYKPVIGWGIADLQCWTLHDHPATPILLSGDHTKGTLLESYLAWREVRRGAITANLALTIAGAGVSLDAGTHGVASVTYVEHELSLNTSWPDALGTDLAVPIEINQSLPESHPFNGNVGEPRHHHAFAELFNKARDEWYPPQTWGVGHPNGTRIYTELKVGTDLTYG